MLSVFGLMNHSLAFFLKSLTEPGAGLVDSKLSDTSFHLHSPRLADLAKPGFPLGGWWCLGCELSKSSYLLNPLETFESVKESFPSALSKVRKDHTSRQLKCMQMCTGHTHQGDNFSPTEQNV